MSEAPPTISKSTKPFVIGLVVGLVVGGLAGALLPTFMEGGGIPKVKPSSNHTSTPGPIRDRPASSEPAPTGTAAPTEAAPPPAAPK